MRMIKPRRLAGWILSAGAVVAAGLLGGWMFGHPGDSTEPQKPKEALHENRLAKETSPYLLLHKHNPVDWYPWGAEAFEKAKAEDKPVFLSIGYSSCYWCHVMERESFSDEEIAKTLNEHFVCIKVDREELPDVDEIYMNAVHLYWGSGGWPLSVFLTPERKPFYGGTYFPPRDTANMRGFTALLASVLTAWQENRPAIDDVAERAAKGLHQLSDPRGFSLRSLDRQVIERAVAGLASEFDSEFGGFGYDPQKPRRPKFPQPCNLELLIYHAQQTNDAQSLAMIVLTLDRMSRGGIRDHLGGGFHRYSTDRLWRIPHFEKMLYDNAQLARVFLEAFQLTKDEEYGKLAQSIFSFIAREMTSPEGGFYSALDAESEHEEGKYYVWTKEEVRSLLPPVEFELFATVHGLKGDPNFEGGYVLQLVDSLGTLAESLNLSRGDLAEMLRPMGEKLLAARQKRQRPLLDTKIMTDWNGLMIAALADGYRILGNEEYRKSAERAADFVLTKARDSKGRLLHIYAGGTAKLPAYLDDHAFLLQGLLALHRATHEARWLDEARTIADQMAKLFWDDAAGGFFWTASDQEIVLARLKKFTDSVTPSGNSAAVRGLVALAERTGDERYAELAGKTLAAFASVLATEPTERPHMVRGLGEYLDAGLPVALLAMRSGGAEPEVVTTRAVLSVNKLKPGHEFQIAVLMEIHPEWHIYANPSSRLEFTPTTLRVSSALPLDAVHVEYPESRTFKAEGVDQAIAVYGGRSMIKATTRLAEPVSPGKGELKLSLRFQACNDQRCLAPKTIEITLPVDVARPDEAVTALYPEIFGDSKSNK